MRIQHNIPAMNSYRNYTSNNKALAKNLEKLSSGYRINRAGDDAAGLAISEKMRAQITGLKAAQKNAKDGISLTQTAEGALTEVHSMLNRMVDLADQSANGTFDDGVDRTNLQKEITALKSEIDRVADASNFNGIKLLNGERSAYTVTGNAKDESLTGAFVTGGGINAADKVNVKMATDGTFTVSATKATKVKFDLSKFTAQVDEGGVFTVTADVSSCTDEAQKAAWSGVTVSFVVGKTTATKASTADKFKAGTIGLTIAPQTGAKGSLTLQVGDSSADYNQMKVSIGDMHAKALGIDKIDIGTQKGAADAVDLLRNAINMVSGTRGDMGAMQNRLDHTINNLSVMTENIQDAEASIRDVDVAEEMMAYTKNNILVQSAQAMLAQANQLPQGVLQLLQ